MTSYGAYNAGLPCKNAACKSHGKPHPNCRCYGADMAEGGEVRSFCGSDNPHKKECEYFRSPNGGTLHDAEVSDAISSYLAHSGIHGLLEMRHHHPDHAMKKYDDSVKKGSKKFHSHIEELFGGSAPEHQNLTDAKETIDEWISGGGAINDLHQEAYKLNSPDEFAHGGDVKKKPHGVSHGHPIEQEYPAQNAMLSMAKGRASNYLSSLRPQPNQPKLAFDDEPDNKQQKKSYERALGIAAHPLSILQKVKKGTIEPEHLAHFNALHPELGDALQKKLTEKITQMQMEGKRPNYKIRQGLSMLLGTPLSGEMSPMNIQAAQAVFRTPSAQPQKDSGSAQGGKKSAVAKSAQAYLLPEDAAASRQQKQ